MSPGFLGVYKGPDKSLGEFIGLKTCSGYYNLTDKINYITYNDSWDDHHGPGHNSYYGDMKAFPINRKPIPGTLDFKNALIRYSVIDDRRGGATFLEGKLHGIAGSAVRPTVKLCIITKTHGEVGLEGSLIGTPNNLGICLRDVFNIEVALPVKPGYYFEEEPRQRKRVRRKK